MIVWPPGRCGGSAEGDRTLVIERDKRCPAAKIADREHAVVVTSIMPPGGTCLDHRPCPPVDPVTEWPLPGPMHAARRATRAGAVDHTTVLTTDGTGMGDMVGEGLRTLLRTVNTLRKGEALGIATVYACHAIANLLRLRDDDRFAPLLSSSPMVPSTFRGGHAAHCPRLLNRKNSGGVGLKSG